MNDAIDQFRAAIRSAELEPPDVIEPGKMHRFPTNGKRGDDAGWCKLFPDMLGGVFGDHRSGLSDHWQAKTDRVMTASEREAFRRMVVESKHQAELEERKRHEAAALKAAAILDAATGDPATHSYLVKKRVSLGSLVKRGPWPQRGWSDALLVPIYGVDERVWSIEAINADGDKDSLKRGKKIGGFYPLGKVRGASRVLVAEGVANAAVGAEVDKSTAVSAMGKSNLLHVALAVRELAPDAELIILADNDLKLPKEAHEAAEVVGARVVIPELDGRTCDFWDLWNERGVEVVRAAIASAKAPASRPGAVVLRVADVEPEPIRWLWSGRIAQGKLTLLAGDPGLGKSLVTLALAAHVTRGTPWPVDSTECPCGVALVLSGEDDIADTIRPRLDAANADSLHVYVLTMIQDLDPETEMLRPRSFSLRRDMAQLDEAVTERPECRLVIIDPISAYLDGTDSHNNSDVRGVLAPLAELAARRKVAVVAISYLNKGVHGSAMYRTTGSLAFVAAARAVYLVCKDKDNPDRRLVLPVKNNLAADNSGMAYSIRAGDNGAPMVMWEPEPVTVTADEALAPTLSEDGDDTPKQEAEGWLRDTLKDLSQMDGKRIKDFARQAGISERTLYRAAKTVGVKMLPGGFSKPRLWHICPMSAKECHVCLAINVGTDGKVGTHEDVNEQDGDCVAVTL